MKLTEHDRESGAVRNGFKCDICGKEDRGYWAVGVNPDRPRNWGTFLKGRLQKDACPTCKETLTV
jgi:hypothetical protein